MCGFIVIDIFVYGSACLLAFLADCWGCWGYSRGVSGLGGDGKMRRV